jgi:hypothetical protein
MNDGLVWKNGDTMHWWVLAGRGSNLRQKNRFAGNNSWNIGLILLAQNTSINSTVIFG